MNPDHFRSPEAGRLVRITGGAFAFVPSPLPPELDFDKGLVNLLSRADALLGELSGLGRQLPNPHLLIAPYTRQEAVLSSRIEGTRTTLSELLLDELGALPEPVGDVREVRNYVAALEHGIERLNDLPLSLRLVQELHGKLLDQVRGGQSAPGEFRRTQNWIGPPGSPLETATYVPPPVPEMMDALDQWERYLHRQGDLPDLVQCALMHEQFEAIHPFLDGNGRIGRLLITLFLMARGRLSQPLLYISAYIEEHRREYYDLLQAVRTDGDWTGWLRFFLAGVEAISKEAVQQAGKRMSLREQWRERLAGSRNAVRLVDALLVNQYMSVARAQRALSVSNPTARQAVTRLQKLGMLTEITGRAWGRLYLTRPILRIIEKAEGKRAQRGDKETP